MRSCFSFFFFLNNNKLRQIIYTHFQWKIYRTTCNSELKIASDYSDLEKSWWCVCVWEGTETIINNNKSNKNVCFHLIASLFELVRVVDFEKGAKYHEVVSQLSQHHDWLQYVCNFVAVQLWYAILHISLLQ